MERLISRLAPQSQDRPLTFVNSDSLPQPPQVRRIVLVGGGHANLQVLLKLKDKLVASDCCEVTLVSDAPFAYYSGMLPATVAQLYPEHAPRIDLVSLAKHCNAEWICAKMIGIDRSKRELICADHPPVPFDLVALNIGARTKETATLPGVAEYAVSTRPIYDLVPKLAAFEAAHPKWDRAPRVVIVGLGAAGVELAFGVRERLLKLSGVESVDMTVVSASILTGTNSALRSSVEQRLRERNIIVHVGAKCTTVEDGLVHLNDGAAISFDLLVWATGPEPHKEVHAACNIELSEDGYVLVNKCLQSTTDLRVFAAGDCAIIASERWVPRAGVYAVREGPVLAENLLRRLRGNGDLVEFEPQKGFLSLMMTGDKQAIGYWKGLVIYNTWIWRLKDKLDRAFVNRFAVSS